MFFNMHPDSCCRYNTRIMHELEFGNWRWHFSHNFMISQELLAGVTNLIHNHEQNKMHFLCTQTWNQDATLDEFSVSAYCTLTLSLCESWWWVHQNQAGAVLYTIHTPVGGRKCGVSPVWALMLQPLQEKTPLYSVFFLIETLNIKLLRQLF